MLTVRLIEGLERPAAHALIVQAYGRKHGIPHFLNQPHTLLAAFTPGNEMVGTIGLSRKQPLGIEGLLDEDGQHALAAKCPSQECRAEIERFATLPGHPSATRAPGALILGLLEYARSLNVRYALAVVKPKTRDFATQCLGLPIYTFPQRLRVERAPLLYRGFFLQKPEPIAILLTLNETMMQAVRAARVRYLPMERLPVAA